MMNGNNETSFFEGEHAQCIYFIIFTLSSNIMISDDQ